MTPSPSNPAGEPVIIVDADNRELGVMPRAEMRRQGLIHRAAYILALNRADEIFVQKRTLTKDVFPGFWDVAAGGVVRAGESYEEAARRELLEELGIRASLARLFDHFYDGPETRVWGRVFACRHEGPFALQKEEIADGRFMDIAAILALNEPVTPDGLEILRRVVAAGCLARV